MLQPLHVGTPASVQPLDSLPAGLQPLAAAANRGDDIGPVVEAIARSFGFDGFMYGVTLSPRPNTESRQYVYLTWPYELVEVYDDRSLIEVDPRIHDALHTVVPKVWEQTTYRGRSNAVDAFLGVMETFGIASGVVCPVRDMHGRTAMLSLSSSIRANDVVRRQAIAQSLGNMMLFGLYFHELFVQGVINEHIPPYLSGRKLSLRERECLTMAAHGLVGEDIAERLGMSLRTIQHHFDSIRSKLGAVNRMEAVAIALSRGIISF